ncbi:hypothetical protein D3C81_1830520 [compost metagenome]
MKELNRRQLSLRIILIKMPLRSLKMDAVLSGLLILLKCREKGMKPGAWISLKMAAT